MLNAKELEPARVGWPKGCPGVWMLFCSFLLRINQSSFSISFTDNGMTDLQVITGEL